MKPDVILTYEFVEYIPEELKECTLYISEKYGTAVHKCCCGCGREIVTPLSPIGWKLTFDENAVSLFPSIGSWGLPCRSHYWIVNNKVEWAGEWSKGRIQKGRKDHMAKLKRYFSKKKSDPTGNRK